MTVLLVILVLMACLGWAYSYVCRQDAVNAVKRAKRYKELWEDALTERGAEDSLIHEWSNRDLMPEWESIYPHVCNMPAKRKYSEWATFCANYPTRESMIAQLALDESYQSTAKREHRGRY